MLAGMGKFFVTWKLLFKYQWCLSARAVFPGGSEVKASACNVGDPGSITGSGRSPRMTTHSSILAWRIPWREEPGGLQVFPSIRVFSNELALLIRWPKYCSFSFSISPSNEYSGLISFRIYWFDLLAVQETLKSLLQHHSSA